MAVAATIENWDDDVDFHGDFHAVAVNSSSTAQGSVSSRISVRSESAAAEEDWNVVLQPNDEAATTRALHSAKLAGIPLPENVPASALLGGAIKRLGRKKMKQKVDDWDHDLEMTDGPLTLKPRPPEASTPSLLDMDDFEDLEGSLGIRFGGVARDSRARSSSVSVLSPSLGSVTADSEIDDFAGLELPDANMDFDALLKKRRAADAELSDVSQPSPAPEQTTTMNYHKKSKLHWDDADDFATDFEYAPLAGLDLRKRTANQNLKIRTSKAVASPSRSATTLNFHDKPTDRPVYNRSHIPRPVSGSKQSASRLEPVFESGAAQAVRERRQPTTTSAQLLRSKRSMPALRNQSSTGSLYTKPAMSYHPAGASSFQSPHSTTQRSAAYHFRRESDPSRQGAHSPPMRPSSRLAQQVSPDTPSRGSRQRPDMAPIALAREATSKRVLTRPTRSRNFGDGSELEIFDDLPTSVVKESKFVKQPAARGPPRPGLRQTQSRSDIRDSKKGFAVPDRMMTPAPRAPPSPTRAVYESQAATPSYLRDTAASRIARESRIGNHARPRSEGPLQPLSTNWKAHVAARSPHASPSVSRQKLRRQPQLITNVGAHVVRNEKGMVFNPETLRWEGNENVIASFDDPPYVSTPTPPSQRPQSGFLDQHAGMPSSPSRPGLIAHIPTGSGHNVQVQNGMVYDPQQMKWLRVKGGRHVSGQLSPSVTDGDGEEDAFAGIEDLKDDPIPVLGGGGGGVSVAGLASPVSAAAPGVGDVHEEFDLGPRFIQLQRDEEAAWRRRCEAWFVNCLPRTDDRPSRLPLWGIVPQDDLAGFGIS